LPHLNELYRKHKEASFVVIGVTRATGKVATFDRKFYKDLEYDAETTLMRRFFQDFGVTFPAVIEHGRTNFDNYKVKFVPTLVIIDRRGIIRKVGHPTGMGLERLITDLLAETPTAK